MAVSRRLDRVLMVLARSKMHRGMCIGISNGLQNLAIFRKVLTPVPQVMMDGLFTIIIRGKFPTDSMSLRSANGHSVTPFKANYMHAANVPLGELKL